MWFVKTFGFLGILALFTIATHGLAKASPGCVASYRNPYYEQARLWVRWQALALRSVAASHSNYGLYSCSSSVCFYASQLSKAMLQTWHASCLTTLHTASRASWRCAARFKAMLRALQGHASCFALFKALLHAALRASRRYFALFKAVLHASYTSCFTCFMMSLQA